MTITRVLAIPLLLWWFGAIANRELWDMSILQKFREVYLDRDESGENFRWRLAPYLIWQIKDQNLRLQLRRFIFWDIMERNFTGPNAVTSFDPDHQDWHLLGETMGAIKTEDDSARRWWLRWYCWRCWTEDDFLGWWTERKREVCKRWPERAKVLESLYDYFDEWYFKKGWDTRAPIAPNCPRRAHIGQPATRGLSTTLLVTGGTARRAIWT